jgi:thiopeptide-type bacteriocin biosynthesis protein
MHLHCEKYALLRVAHFAIEFWVDKLSDGAEDVFDWFLKDRHRRNVLLSMSPDFAERVITESNRDAGARATLLRYAGRLCTRSTPLGLGATVSALRVGVGSLPTVSEGVFSKVRLDAQLLFRLLQRAIESHEAFSSVSVNGTLCCAGDSYQYISIDLHPLKRAVLRSTMASEAIDAVVKLAKHPITLSVLASRLVEYLADPELSENDCMSFVTDLVRQQFLTHDHLLVLEPETSVERLAFCSAAQNLAAQLAATGDALSKSDADWFESLRIARQQIEEYLQVQIGMKSIYETTALRELTTSAVLPQDIGKTVCETVALLLQAGRQVNSPFGDDLGERWESLYGDADVPLLKLPLGVDGLFSEGRPRSAVFSALPERIQPQGTPLAGRDASEIIQTTIALGCDDIRLSADDITKDPDTKTSPSDITAWLHLWEKEDGALVVELSSFGTWPIGRLLGRFSDHLEPIKELLSSKAMSRPADTGDSVRADIVYHPRARIANVCRRAATERYAVAIRCSAGRGTTEIPLDDLVVCHEAGELRLRSIALGKWVDLTLNTAYNHELKDDVPLFRFLARIVQQRTWAIHGLTAARASGSYLPRLWLGTVLLERARWRLRRAEATELLGLSRLRGLQFAWGALREKYRMPRFVRLHEEDSYIPVDLESDLGLTEVNQHLSRFGECELSELFPCGMRPALKDQKGRRYAHEILLPLQAKVDSPKSKGSSAQRAIFGVGVKESWSYALLYVHPTDQAKLLIWLSDWLDLCNKTWFFVRYRDFTGYHIRLRIRDLERSGLEALLISAARAEADALWSCFSMKTYRPEVNRYGGSFGLKHSHDVFCATSNYAVELFRANSAGKAEKVLWCVDKILDSLRFDLPAKIRLAERLSRGFSREYGIKQDLRLEAERISKKLPLQFDDFGSGSHDGVASVLSSAGRAISDLAAAGSLCRGVEEIASSLSHMTFNRLCVGDPRAEEAVYWDVLRRWYLRRRSCA